MSFRKLFSLSPKSTDRRCHAGPLRRRVTRHPPPLLRQFELPAVASPFPLSLDLDLSHLNLRPPPDPAAVSSDRPLLGFATSPLGCTTTSVSARRFELLPRSSPLPSLTQPLKRVRSDPPPPQIRLFPFDPATKPSSAPTLSDPTVHASHFLPLLRAVAACHDPFQPKTNPTR